ncbi:hypothetical protein BGZ70_003886, partial [Mortierella alpina]
NQCEDLQEHCEKFIDKNRSGVRMYVEDDLAYNRKRLNELSEDGHGAERADLRVEIEVSERNLEELDALT